MGGDERSRGAHAGGRLRPMADLHTTVAGALREQGQRYTAVRRSLVELLAAAGRPLAIPELLERDRDIAQSSAYRNLALLERAGVVRRIVATDEHARYELTEDLSEHHHHLICAACGRVDDFVTNPRVERILDRAMDEVTGATGFAPTHHRLDLVGLCARCA